jgi:hypothetical protein
LQRGIACFKDDAHAASSGNFDHLTSGERNARSNSHVHLERARLEKTALRFLDEMSNSVAGHVLNWRATAALDAEPRKLRLGHFIKTPGAIQAGDEMRVQFRGIMLSEVAA